jgi:hypothetical protein
LVQYAPRAALCGGLLHHLGQALEETTMRQRTSLLAIGIAAACCQLASADESFAIRTQIYSPEQTRPVAENVTIFQAGTIYDFSDTQPATVTVFDRKSRTFTLAQCDAQIQTVLSANELVRFAATQQAEAQQSDNELVRFAADPTFAESFDADSGRLTLTSPWWDYRVATRKYDDERMRRSYAEFANWYTYLNSLFRPLPPAVRLKLNEALDQRQCLPEHVVVQIKRDGEVVMRQESRHELIAPLGERELARISAWQQQRGDLRTVDFATYRRAR